MDWICARPARARQNDLRKLFLTLETGYLRGCSTAVKKLSSSTRAEAKFATLTTQSSLPLPKPLRAGPLVPKHPFHTSRIDMGVTVQTTQKGDGQHYPKPNDKVSMHYTGTLESGKKFDSSVDRGQPFSVTIGVGQVIRGWDEGVPQMSLGEKAKLTITGDYAYGDRGFPGLIPPNATLIFDVHLLSINGKNAA